MQTVLSLFLFALAIAYVEYRLKSINRRQDEDQRDAFDRYATKEGLKATTERLTVKQQAELRALNERMASIENRTFFSNNETTPQPAVPEPEPEPMVLYFRWPADDGTFDDNTRQTVQTEDTFYEFALHEDRCHADVRFVTMSETQLNKANNSSKKYIERACSFTGTKSVHYTCLPGTAHLERGRWHIDEKVRISYS